jgi:predicted AAA+ superfamily ATPase
LKIKHEIYYWSAQNATAEIDFMIQKEQMIIPIEVKAEENLKSKSLKVFVDKFQTQQNLRFSMNNRRVQDWMTNMPLYSANNL